MTIESLYERCYDELVRFAEGMTGERQSAQDLVQDAFFRAVLHEAQVEPLDEHQARAWLYRTVKRAFVDRYRRARREVLTDEPPELSAPQGAYDEAEWKLLLSLLPPPLGEMLWMHEAEGYTSEALGRAFGLPPGTVRYKLHTARKQLKRMLGGTDYGRKEFDHQL